MSKLSSDSNGANNPSRQRKTCPSCMQYGRMRRSHQSCPENLRNNQALIDSIANRSGDLSSDTLSSTNVSFEDKNESHSKQKDTDDVALSPTAKCSEI
ncbi:hypothetical protein MAM1_0025d02087 [Mucor ambiguus]|uniref:Uncharacterized protein n=1 Tax=Mucor ambiguus TaxID=91626 RepID=A0A0C9MHQ4_9FUNG|nr:hypothetical protein MAM1_0025d02087 [Mucor ambiguus]